MKLYGSIHTVAAPEKVLQLLRDPITLGKIAPDGFVSLNAPPTRSLSRSAAESG